MKDPRLTELCKNLINYSVDLQKGEKVLIEISGNQKELIDELVNQVYLAEGIPFVSIKDNYIERALMKNATKEQMELRLKYEAVRMEDMDAFLGIRSPENLTETSDVPSEKMSIYNDYFMAPLTMDIRVPKTKWVALRYPNPSLAQASGMSTESFEDYYFKVCNLDYKKMSLAMDPLLELMENTDKVRLTGKDTDISFSIKDMGVVKCDGRLNIPDGEVFSAPVKESVNGVISFNAPAVFQGYTYENIKLEFKDGKIIKATANDTEKINKVFDTDEGARYVGEFAIGVNPYITSVMKDTLFDEKIAGSIHFTPGNCVPGCRNENKSLIHWDLVLIQRQEYGGGEIYFDDKLIRKDGLFVLPELKGLNPEYLKI